METLSHDKILEYLKKEYKHYVNLFGKNQILGTFCIGRANYGFARKLEDLHFITVYIPTFEELCVGNCEHNGTATMLGQIYDIRYAYTATSNDKISPLEFLFCNDYIITDKYKKIFITKFLDNREKIGKYNKKSRIKKCYLNAQKSISERDFFNAARLQLAATLFSSGASVNDCFHIKDPIYIKYLSSVLANPRVFDAEDCLCELEALFEEASDEGCSEAYSLIKEGILSIIYEGLNDHVSIDTFVESLTNTEKKAWEILKNKLTNGAIVISISKLIEETSISRPIWKNLFLKLEQNNIAKIENQGMKGTSITPL